MGKVKVYMDENKEFKGVEKITPSEVIFHPKENSLGKELIRGVNEAVVADMLNEHTKNLMIRIHKLETKDLSCQCKCEKAKPDTRLRRYVKAIRKELLDKAESGSISLLNKRMDVQAQNLDAIVEDVNGLHDKSDILKLEKELLKINHQIDLIEQDMKIKPISIKTEKVIHTFDHKLVLFNILMLFLNVVFVLQILSN